MKSIFKIALTGVLICLFLISGNSAKQIQMYASNGKLYGRRRLYRSFTNQPKGDYEKTLYVMGDDKKWYKSLKEWNKFHTAKNDDISAISGASVTGGDRSVTTFEIEDSKINKGYKLRFESAVEDQKYYVSDLEIPLTTEGLADKTEGKGYIRYVKLIKI